MRKLMGIFSIFALILAGTFAGPTEHVSAAKSSKELQQEIEELKQKQSELDAKREDALENKSETESELSSNIAKQEKIDAQMKELDEKVSKTSSDIRAKEEQIAKTNDEIEQTEKEIAQLKKEIKELIESIAKREQLLKDRLRTLQKNGGDISYLEVIMESKDFGDFLNRTSAVNKIMGQDQKILETHQSEKKALEEKKIEVEEKKKNLETKKANLEEQKQQLESLKAQLDKQLDQKRDLMAELEHQEQELHDKKMEFAEQAEVLQGQAAAMKAEQRRTEQAKSAAEQREAEALAAKRAAEQARKNNNSSSNNGSSNSSSNSGGSVSTPAPAPSVSGFIRPAAGPVTSTFGARWGTTHPGIDLGRSGSSNPIKAAASGTVIKSYYSSSYGNVVFLTHSIGGQVYTTVYAHMSSRNVSDGQSVSQGQVLGQMGSTGYSTGPHLHFELHKGPWNASKSNAVNPASYINF